MVLLQEPVGSQCPLLCSLKSDQRSDRTAQCSDTQAWLCAPQCSFSSSMWTASFSLLSRLWPIALGTPTYPVRLNHARPGVELDGFQSSSLFLLHPVLESERSPMSASALTQCWVAAGTVATFWLMES